MLAQAGWKHADGWRLTLKPSQLIVGAALPILVEQQAAHNEGESPVQHAHHMRVLESKVEDRRKIHAELLAYKQDALRYKSCHIQHPSDRAERSGHVRALREQNAGHALAMHAWTNTSTDAREQSSAELDRLRTMHDNLVDEVHRLLRPAGETGSMMEATSSSSVELSLMHQAVREDLAAQETAMLHACEIDASAAELARLTGLNADLLVCVASLRESNTTLVRVVAEHELAEQEMARLHAYETEVSTSKAHHLRRFNSYLIKLVMSLRNDTDAGRQTPTPHELAVLDTAAAAASTPGLDPAVGVAIDEAAADEQMRTDYADTPPSANHGNNFAGPPVIVKELNVSDLETAKRAPAEWVPADAPGEGDEIVGAALPILVEQQAAHNGLRSDADAQN